MASRVGVIGKDGRTSAIVRALLRNSNVEAKVLSAWKQIAGRSPLEEVLDQARAYQPEFIIVGPEAPLAAGVVDRLREINIPCVGPTQALAQLESSKAFTRELLQKYNIPGNPQYRVFKSLEGIADYLKQLGEYVVKPDGLTGGKGVKLSNEHLFSVEEAVEYCAELFAEKHPAVVVEEKLEGEEFSLQAFCDGEHVVDMVPVQDHKRAHEGDTGPNTGGMGSYSLESHSFPFVRDEELKQAKEINYRVAQALRKETGSEYKGILYGGFMVTPRGLRLLEYNARFGDPETLNVLSLLESDFYSICKHILEGTLRPEFVKFQKLASVCKYVVPDGYPDKPVKDARIVCDVPEESPNLKRYDAAVELRNGELTLTGSRALAFVGLGKSLEDAETIAEKAASSVKGPVYHRRDIGTHALFEKRISHMAGLRGKSGAVISN
jgi:phosphoribosylamine--glycine ligase